MRLREAVRFSAVVWMLLIADWNRFWYAPRAARVLSICDNAASTEARVALALLTLNTSTFEIAVPVAAAATVCAVTPAPAWVGLVPPTVNDCEDARLIVPRAVAPARVEIPAFAAVKVPPVLVTALTMMLRPSAADSLILPPLSEAVTPETALTALIFEMTFASSVAALLPRSPAAIVTVAPLIVKVAASAAAPPVAAAASVEFVAEAVAVMPDATALIAFAIE